MMAGLLEALNSEEGMQALGLLSAAGPSATPMSFGQRLFGAMQQDQARRSELQDRKTRQQMQALQMQQLMEAAAGRKKAAEQEQSRLGYLGSVDPSQGPAMPVSTPRALAAGLSLPEIGALMPQQGKTTTLSPGQQVFGPDGKPLFGLPAAPEKPEATPASIREYQFAVGQGFKGSFEQWDTSRKRAGASSVAVQYGAPMIGRDASGNDVFFAPPKDPTKPPVVLGGVTPPKKAPPVEFTKSVAGLNELENGLKTYETTLKDNGGVSPLSMGAKRANLQASYTSLQMGLKNAFELGALAGPDLSLLQGMLIDPTSPTAALVGDKGVAAQINKAREYLKNRRAAVYKAHGESPPTDQPAAPNVVNFADLK